VERDRLGYKSASVKEEGHPRATLLSQSLRNSRETEQMSILNIVHGPIFFKKKQNITTFSQCTIT